MTRCEISLRMRPTVDCTVSWGSGSRLVTIMRSCRPARRCPCERPRWLYPACAEQPLRSGVRSRSARQKCGRQVVMTNHPLTNRTPESDPCNTSKETIWRSTTPRVAVESMIEKERS